MGLLVQICGISMDKRQGVFRAAAFDPSLAAPATFRFVEVALLTYASKFPILGALGWENVHTFLWR